MVIMMLDATKGDKQKDLLTMELESVGIRLNKNKPGIYFKVSEIFTVKERALLIYSVCSFTQFTHLNSLLS